MQPLTRVIGPFPLVPEHPLPFLTLPDRSVVSGWIFCVCEMISTQIEVDGARVLGHAAQVQLATVRALVVMVLLAGTVSSCGTAATPAAAVDCGATTPFSVGLEGLGVTSILQPSAEPSDGSVVTQWETRRSLVELRWPAGHRELFADHRPTEADGFGVAARPEGVGRRSIDMQTPYDSMPFATLLIVVPDQPAIDAMPVECQSARLTITSDDGGRSTAQIHLSSSSLAAPVEDFGPLIGRRMAVTRVLQPAEVALCSGVHAQPIAAVGAPVMPSAPEALRAFLESSASSGVPRMTLWRPFDEIRPPDQLMARPEANTVRYEHFLAWVQFVSIDVTRVPGGWVATAWRTGQC